jgi:hypothetical protein
MKIHPRQLASWKLGPEFIHPDDFTAAINARVRQKFADSKRKARNPKTIQAIEEELYVTWLAGEGINFWSDRTRNDIFLYAMMNGIFCLGLGAATANRK